MQLAAARRRRVVLILVALTLIVAAVSWVGRIPVWSAAVPAALLVVFLVIARRHVRRVHAALRRPAAMQESQQPSVVTSGAVRVDATHGSTRSAGAQAVAKTRSSMDHSDGEPTVKIRTGQSHASQPDTDTENFGGWAARAAESRAAGGPVVAGYSRLSPGDGSPPAATVTAPAADQTAPVVADGASLWDPLPVTLPTYVDKSVARRTVRRIQLGETGTWTSGHSQADSQTVAKAESEAADDAARTDDAASRAVNG